MAITEQNEGSCAHSPIETDQGYACRLCGEWLGNSYTQGVNDFPPTAGERWLPKTVAPYSLLGRAFRRAIYFEDANEKRAKLVFRFFYQLADQVDLPFGPKAEGIEIIKDALKRHLRTVGAKSRMHLAALTLAYVLQKYGDRKGLLHLFSIVKFKKFKHHIHKFVAKMGMPPVKERLDTTSQAEQLCNALAVPQHYRKKIAAILSQYKTLSACSPAAIAGAAIYIVCRRPLLITQKKLVGVTGLTEVTLRRHVRNINKFLKAHEQRRAKVAVK